MSHSFCEEEYFLKIQIYVLVSFFVVFVLFGLFFMFVCLSSCLLLANEMCPPDIRSTFCETLKSLNVLEAVSTFEGAFRHASFIRHYSCLLFAFLQGALYHKTGNLVMAEKVLREAINIDPTAFEAW